jgi:hypothetical protein
MCVIFGAEECKTDYAWAENLQGGREKEKGICLVKSILVLLSWPRVSAYHSENSLFMQRTQHEKSSAEPWVFFSINELLHAWNLLKEHDCLNFSPSKVSFPQEGLKRLYARIMIQTDPERSGKMVEG